MENFSSGKWRKIELSIVVFRYTKIVFREKTHGYNNKGRVEIMRKRGHLKVGVSTFERSKILLKEVPSKGAKRSYASLKRALPETLVENNK